MSKIKLINSNKEYDILFSLEKDKNIYYAFKDGGVVYFGKTTKNNDIIKALEKEEEVLLKNVLNKLLKEGKNDE